MPTLVDARRLQTLDFTVIHGDPDDPSTRRMKLLNCPWLIAISRDLLDNADKKYLLVQDTATFMRDDFGTSVIYDILPDAEVAGYDPLGFYSSCIVAMKRDTPAMGDSLFRLLMDAFMSADPSPWPAEMDTALRQYLDVEARRRNYDSWIEAFHEFQSRHFTVDDF